MTSKLNSFCEHKSYDGLPIPEDKYLVPFFIENWDTVKTLNMDPDNLETWHINGIRILVAFIPVSEEQFMDMLKFCYDDIREYIAGLRTDPRVISYDALVDASRSDIKYGHDPAAEKTFEEIVINNKMLDELIRLAEKTKPRYALCFKLLREQYDRADIVLILQQTYGIKTTQSYTVFNQAIKFAQKFFAN